MAATVNVFVIDPIRNLVSGELGTSSSRLAIPYPFSKMTVPPFVRAFSCQSPLRSTAPRPRLGLSSLAEKRAATVHWRWGGTGVQLSEAHERLRPSAAQIFVGKYTSIQG